MIRQLASTGLRGARDLRQLTRCLGRATVGAKGVRPRAGQRLRPERRDPVAKELVMVRFPGPPHTWASEDDESEAGRDVRQPPAPPAPAPKRTTKKDAA